MGDAAMSLVLAMACFNAACRSVFALKMPADPGGGAGAAGSAAAWAAPRPAGCCACAMTEVATSIAHIAIAAVFISSSPSGPAEAGQQIVSRKLRAHLPESPYRR